MFVNNDNEELIDDIMEIEDDSPIEYKEETWGKTIDGKFVIDGYKFKGKQSFKNAKEELEKLMIRGSHYKIGNFIIQVLDSRNKGIELEADIAIQVNEKYNRGIAVIKLYGPNKRKENTVTITKNKQSDIQFVTLMAEKVMKPLLKMIIEEPNFSKEKIETGKANNPFRCQKCEKSFKTQQGFKSHLTKKHREDQEIKQTEKSTESDTEILLNEKECNEDNINLDENVHGKEAKKYFFTCSKCGNKYSRKYELIQHSLKHKKMCSPIKIRKNKESKHCQSCDLVFNKEQDLKRHRRDTHDFMSVSTSPPPKKTKATQSTNIIWQEDMDIDEKETAEDMEIDNLETEEAIRSKLMDEKIRNKEEIMEENERTFQEQKLINENRKKKLKEIEIENQKQLIKQKRQRRKDEKKRSQKVNKKKKTDTKSGKIIPNLKPIPRNIAHLVEEGDMVYCVPGDGACGPNSISAHLFKDEVYGSKLRLNMNHFMVKHWDKKYKYKTQCSDGHPFKRRIGGGGQISFTDPTELLKFLEKSEEAALMWTDSEDLAVVSDMYQVRIKVINTRGEGDKNPMVYWILPDDDMKQFAELQNVEIPNMVLLHENDVHFNLIVSKDSDLAKNGSISFDSNIGPIQNIKDTMDTNETKKRTFSEVEVNS